MRAQRQAANVQQLRPMRDLNAWALFALANAIEAKERAECREARLRQILDRVSRINPVMVRNVQRSVDSWRY